MVVMRKGDELLKYCRRSKPHVCHFSLSPDEAELQWVSKNGTLRRLRFDQVSDVVAGRSSAVFRCGFEYEKCCAHAQTADASF